MALDIYRTLVEKLRGKSSKPKIEHDLSFLSDLLEDEPEKDAVCTLDLQEDLPDSDHKSAAMALGTALITKEFSEFEKLLDEEVSLVLYDDRTIRGKDAVASYWRNFLAKETTGTRMLITEMHLSKSYQHLLRDACIQH